MHKRLKQFNPSGIKWPTEVDMLLNKTPAQTLVKNGENSVLRVKSKIKKRFLRWNVKESKGRKGVKKDKLCHRKMILVFGKYLKT